MQSIRALRLSRFRKNRYPVPDLEPDTTSMLVLTNANNTNKTYRFPNVVLVSNHVAANRPGKSIEQTIVLKCALS